MHIAQNILDAVNEWLTPTFDNETQVAIKGINDYFAKRTGREFL